MWKAKEVSVTISLKFWRCRYKHFAFKIQFIISLLLLGYFWYLHFFYMKISVCARKDCLKYQALKHYFQVSVLDFRWYSAKFSLGNVNSVVTGRSCICLLAGMFSPTSLYMRQVITLIFLFLFLTRDAVIKCCSSLLSWKSETLQKKSIGKLILCSVPQTAAATG